MLAHARTLALIGAAAVLTMITGPNARAENVDVSTIPQRDTVQLTIYNSEDLTLVRETRHITFAEGLNPLQFSWANTLIDPTSVDLRFRTHADKLDVLDTTFPHDKPQMLYWNVQSEINGAAVVEITYFTSGISWAADYVCTADVDETELAFDGFVRITNHSGENYEDASVRLVVGTINLVEKVADLARRGLVSDDEVRAYKAGRRRGGEFNAPQARAEMMDGVAGGMALGMEMDAKEIVKEGLSEYFIYTIEGTETVPNGWSKRMRLFDSMAVPFETVYRYRPAEYGDQLVRLFILTNDEESGLGTTPLPDGDVRLFRENGNDGLSYLVQYFTKYVPIGQKIELNLGPDREVIHEWIKVGHHRDNFWFREGNSRRYFSLDRGQQIKPNYSVAGWDEHEQWVERIRNYRDEPIAVEIRRSFYGHVVFTSELDPKLYDYQSPEFSMTVDPGRWDYGYEVTYTHGVNEKQNNVTLKTPQ